MATALSDSRVDWETIQAGQALAASQYQQGKYYLQFSVLSEIAPETLLFDVARIPKGVE